nr:reverse transcriptase domain-containing protein [Tanacetum cinerariifolium]
MTKKDEEKTAFHTDEGVFCYTKIPFGLKNARATYQRLVDIIFKGKIGRNLEAYVDDMVIKSKTELEIIKHIKETLLTLKKVNMKLNPKKCSFRIEEGKFLGYIVTSEGIRANLEKTKAIVNMPSPTNLKQMQRLSGKLATLNRFVSKAAKKGLPCLDTLKSVQTKRTFIGQQRYNGRGQPTQIKATGLNDTLAKGKSVEEQEALEAKALKNLGIEVDLWTLYTDGASNEHRSGAGLILIDPEGAEYSYALRLKFANSNNDMEYEALLAGLRISTKMKVEKNRAVERTNRSIMQGIKTRLHQEGRAWVEELPNLLWAHRKTPKISDGKTPFSLAYGTEAVVPAKIGIPTRRTVQRSDEENEDALRKNLNLLEEHREIATTREAR